MPLNVLEDQRRGGGDQEGTMTGTVPPVVDKDFRGHVDREGGQRRKDTSMPPETRTRWAATAKRPGTTHRAGQVDEVVRRVELSGARLDDEVTPR